MIKHFTAEKARVMANNSKASSRLVKNALRSIKHAAKKGRYNLILHYTKWDDTIASEICNELEALGYATSLKYWQLAIYVSWRSLGRMNKCPS